MENMKDCFVAAGPTGKDGWMAMADGLLSP